MQNDEPRTERPRVQPEIIPPDRGGRSSGQRGPWHGVYERTHATHRVYVAKLGPFAIALLMLALAAIVAIVMIVVIGAALIWIPVLAVMVLIAAVIRLVRG